MKRATIPSLTGLRFAAAFAVLISHAMPRILNLETTPLALDLLQQTAAEGMTLFFVLSGFVIYYNYSDSIGRRAGLYEFFVARFARLYPLYLVGLTYDMLVTGEYSRHGLGALPYYLTLTQSWFYKPIHGTSLIYQYGPIPQLTWSISTEWFFYIVFPLVCFGIAVLPTLRQRLVAVALLVVVVFAGLLSLNAEMTNINAYGIAEFGQFAASLQDTLFRWIAYFSPYVRIFEFILGCLCAAIFLKLEAPPSPAEQNAGRWLAIGAILGLFALHFIIFGIHSRNFWYLLLHLLHLNFAFAPLLALLIFCCARYDNGVSRFMSLPWIVLCGEASYSLYLGHIIVINAFGYESPAIPWPHGRVLALAAATRLVVVIFAAIGLSLVTWSTIERPARRWLRRLLSPKAEQEPAAEPEHVAGERLSPKLRIVRRRASGA
jgi:peptidoglycan/LPS O-acetylase OafA/YrhL